MLRGLLMEASTIFTHLQRIWHLQWAKLRKDVAKVPKCATDLPQESAETDVQADRREAGARFLHIILQRSVSDTCASRPTTL